MLDINSPQLGTLDALTQLQVILPVVRQGQKDLEELKKGYETLLKLVEKTNKDISTLQTWYRNLEKVVNENKEAVKKLQTKKVSQLSLGKKK